MEKGAYGRMHKGGGKGRLVGAKGAKGAVVEALRLNVVGS